jgi:hypothetical protein
MMEMGTFYDGVEITRKDRIIHARFLVPHRVVSTCRVAGGISESLQYLYNHQACEPTGHHRAGTAAMTKAPADYRMQICEKHGLPAEKCATLGTAANMQYASFQHRTFRLSLAQCAGCLTFMTR